MFKFFSDAFKEVGHVVWPTKKETRMYMWYNVAIIIFMTIFLSLAGFGFRSGLQAAKHAINPPYIPTEAELEANQAASEASERAKFGLDMPEVTDVETSNETDTTTENLNTEETTTTENTDHSTNTENTEDSITPSTETETEATQNNQ